MYAPKLGFLKHAVISATLSLGIVQGASAGIIFSNSALPVETGTFTVQFGREDLGAVPGPGNTVTGVAGKIGKNDKRYLVNFSSSELLTGSGIVVDGADTHLNELKLNVQDGAFSMLSLNFRAPNAPKTAPQRYGEIIITAFGGETVVYQLPLANNANIFRVIATGDTLLRSIEFTSDINMLDVRNIRIGGLQDAPLPEPTTLLSLGAGMLGMMAVRRRRKPQ